MSISLLRALTGFGSVFCLLVASFARDESKSLGEMPLTDLNLEVNALYDLYRFNFTKPQMKQLQKWAKETVQEPHKRDAGKASKELRDKMHELYNALALADDDDKIEQINEQLDELREAEEPAIDDNVDATDAARRRAPEVFQLLKANQLAMYVARVADSVPDPLDRLTEGMEKARELKGSEWREKRDEIADEVSRLVVGLDLDKTDRMNDQIVALLIRARSLSDVEYPKQMKELENAARKIIGDVSSAQVLRHYVENELATLLSNPRLPAALEARLK